MSIQDKLSQLPKSPGVYFFKNARDEIIYIGKAKVLRNRVRSYFQSTKNKDSKTRLLVSNIADLEWLVVRDEVEAFLTESNLIKEHKPRFNLSLKDDKSFPYIQITNEPYPRVQIVRMKKFTRDGHRYFGPYTEVKRLRETMYVIHRIFPLRTCEYYIDDKTIKQGKIKVCLDYHIQRCEGPCEGLVSQENYDLMIQQIILFLRGRNDDVKNYLKANMQSASEEQRYEDAARFRNQLESVIHFTRKQKKVGSDFTDRDIIVISSESNYGVAVVLRVRNGFFLGREKFNLNLADGTPLPEIGAQFFRQYYSTTDDIPAELLLETDLEEREQNREWFSKIHGRSLKIKIPERGEKKNLVKICRKNAELLLSEIRLRKEKRKELVPKSVLQLQEDLQMKAPPRRIDAFDNSNIQGTHPVASLVCFMDGKPRKSEYRKYNIKTVSGIDDFESMYEVVKRRYTRVLEEKKPLPDLVLIDGGKGQLRFAKKALDELKLDYLEVIGLAKRLEEVFKPGLSEPQNISKTSPGLFLLRKVRDEAHRFAITFHREKRSKSMIKSKLDDIPGLGKTRIQAIWKNYKSINELASDSADDIKLKTGIPLKIAEKILEELGGGEVTRVTKVGSD